MTKHLVVVAMIASMLGACAATQRAASEDPMKCERDPKCDKKRSKSADCSTQCNDDPACMDRCEQINQQTGNGRLGR